MSSAFGTLSPSGPPPANRYDEKLKQLAYAAQHLDKLTHERTLSADDRKLQFAYHFSAFIGAAGALRQYAQDDLEKGHQIKVPTDQAGAVWFDDFNDQVDIATVIGLRNTDVHDLSVQVTGVQHELSFLAKLQFNAAANIRVPHKCFDPQLAWLENWWARFTASRRKPAALPTPVPPIQQYAARYHLDPMQLGNDFMVADRARPVWWTPSRNTMPKYTAGD